MMTPPKINVDKKCYVYCGDDKCDCYLALIHASIDHDMSEWLGTINMRIKKSEADGEPKPINPDIKYNL